VRADPPVPAADVHRNTLLPGDDAIAHERAQTDRHQRAGKLCEYTMRHDRGRGRARDRRLTRSRVFDVVAGGAGRPKVRVHEPGVR